MDTKKLFEYEYLVESMRPELSKAELITTFKAPEAASSQELENIVSFNLSAGEDGLYLKFIDAKGNQKKLHFLNPVVAKSLAASLMQSLSAQGYVEDELTELDEVDTPSLH